MGKLEMQSWIRLALIAAVLGSVSTLSQRYNGSQFRGESSLINPLTDGWPYPTFLKDESISDNYYGVEVKDPYRKLETHLDVKVVEFERLQNDLAEKYVAQEPSRNKVEARMKEMDNYSRYGDWKYVNGILWALYNPGTNEQNYLMRYGSNGYETIINTDLEYEHTYTAIRGIYPSPDGKHIAFNLYRKGSDWEEIQIIRTDQKATRLPIKILWSKFNSAITWSLDSSGIFYNAYSQPKDISADQAGLETERSVYLGTFYHSLFTRSFDKMIINPKANMHIFENKVISFKGYSEYREISNSTGLFIIKGSELNGGKSDVFIRYADSNANTLAAILPNFPNNKKDVVEVRGSRIYIITDIEAPNYRLIAVDITDPLTIIPIIPEYKDKMLTNAYLSKTDKLLVQYLWDGVSKLELFNLLTFKSVESVKVEFGNIYGVTYNYDFTEINYKVQNFISRNQEFSYNFATKTTKLVNEEKIPGFESSNFVQKSTTCTSKDGQEIPVLYVHRKGLIPDGKKLVFLYAYGGFKSKTTPYFDKLWAYLIENEDAVVALPLIRGNSDRGDSWYEAGNHFNKQKTLDDMAAAVNFFQTNPETKFGSPKTTFIHGISNGGFMTAATCNQVPEKLAGCFAEVGVHDLIRFPLFTVGSGWASDYGNVNFSKRDLENILKISPLHNVLPTGSKGKKTYPHLWISTGEYDDRVSKLHSFKLAATIQQQHKYAMNPAFLYVNWKSGHGSGRSKSQNIKDLANKVAFMKLAIKANLN